VTVRPQVDGKLLSIGFKEGEDVAKGQVLARIDATTYQAALDQALAKKAQDEALLANANVDLERYARLAATNSITKQQADTQRSLVAQLQAQVNSDQAAIDNARAIVAYTTIIAPISGRTGLRQVDEGNIVHASDATGLVVLTEVKPISVFYNLPQQQLPQVNAAFGKAPLAVEAIRSDDQSVLDKGVLKVIDNQVDQTTGTVKLKAEFPNAQLQLWPGQFVNVRMLVDTLHQVVTVPTAAIQRGPDGAFVYVVSNENTVAMRPVTVTRQDDVQAVIGDGVKTGERVVTTGFTQLTDGRRVQVSAGDGSATTTTPPAARRPGNRQRRQNGPESRSNDEGAPRRQGGGRAPTDTPAAGTQAAPAAPAANPPPGGTP
jgi:multidrug efflux system membrane fusion protein